jgi:hypothetical protein
MKERIASLASEIRRTYESLRQRAHEARDSDPSLVSKVGKAPIPASVCAVDGGLLAQRVHGADIVLCRAVGVNFVYESSRLREFSYHPSKSPEPRVEFRSSLDEHEANVFSSLVRLREELGCAISSLEKFSPAVLLMDGSLLPLPSDHPGGGSQLGPLYSEVLSLYSGLFRKCSEKGCVLCGVVKDSRARKLSKPLGVNCSDGILCGYLLDEWERTKALPYFDDKAPSKELAALGERVSVFYLKPSKNDLPLRIEAYDCDEGHAASLVCGLCAISERFAYPAILIEADMCAALEPKEMEFIEESLVSLSGMKPLRRNSRPFR